MDIYSGLMVPNNGYVALGDLCIIYITVILIYGIVT